MEKEITSYSIGSYLLHSIVRASSQDLELLPNASREGLSDCRCYRSTRGHNPLKALCHKALGDVGRDNTDAQIRHFSALAWLRQLR